MLRGAKTVRGLLLVGGFVALAAFKTWPLLAHFGTRLGGPGTDAISHLWILAWGVHALATNPLSLFEGNLAYPLEHSLAFCEHFLGALPLFAPVYLLTGNIIAGYNTVVWLSAALAALGGFALAWKWTRCWWPAIVAGTLFGFAPLRLSHVGHFQLFTFFWAAWALLFLDRFLRRRRWRDLSVFAVFYWLQILSSFYLGMMLTVGVVVCVGYYAIAVDRGLLGRAMVSRALAFGAASVAVLLPTHFAYLQVQRAWEFAWTPGSMAGYSADVQSYLSAPALVNDLYVSLFRPVTPAGAHERLLFPGLILPALVLLGLIGRVRGIAEVDVRRARRLFGLMAVIAFVLSLGPYLLVWGVNTRLPMPYLLFYYVVPGWSAMRVPARFALLLLLAAVPLSALGAQALVARAAALGPETAWRRLAPAAVGLTLVGLFLMELGAKPWPLQDLRMGRDVPEVYRWLARERPGPIVEIPVALPQHEQDYLYFSTVHWLPIVNGRTSFAPSSHDAAKAILAELPGPRGREHAAALGLRAIVVHGDLLSREERLRWILAERAGHVRRLAGFGSDLVYAVDAVPLAPALRARLAVPDELPSASDVRLGLRLENDDARPWAHGRPHRADHAIVRWTGPAAEATRTTGIPVVLPLVVGAGDSVAMGLKVSTPTVPGRYTLDVTLKGQGLATGRRTVDVRESPARLTSAEPTDRLAARYLLEDGPRPRVLTPADSLHLKLVAMNTGHAVWLSRPRGKKGDVALEWKWLDRGGRAMTGLGGQVAIRYDVHPGQSYEFNEWATIPAEPGRYIVELNLVRGGLGAFAAEPPAKIVVDVTSSSADPSP